MYFNPRSHEGSDNIRLSRCQTGLYFNPRSHEGSDLYESTAIHKILYFNPRSHEGSDEMRSPSSGCSNEFQSTLPRGERPGRNRKDGHGYTISIHAPTRGATLLDVKCDREAHISIHAPTRGATGQICHLVHFPYISIHAPTRGATPVQKARFYGRIFQSTLPRGERRTQVTIM